SPPVPPLAVQIPSIHDPKQPENLLPWLAGRESELVSLTAVAASALSDLKQLQEMVDDSIIAADSAAEQVRSGLESFSERRSKGSEGLAQLKRVADQLATQVVNHL